MKVNFKDQGIKANGIGWNGYKKELQRFIRSPESGMLLQADDYPAGKNKKQSSGALFQLTSGKLAKEYVTIWELFDDRKNFRQCMEMLGQKAMEIREDNYYSMIVTCTSTAKELANHIKTSLDDKGDILLSHFGDYPSIQVTHQYKYNFRDVPVLILTDVVASGTLVRNLGEIIEKKGGNVVAVLAVLITNTKMIERGGKPGKAPFIELSSGKKICIHHLTEFPITYLDEPPNEKYRIIKIDPVTVLPEQPMEPLFEEKPVFSIARAFQHFEKVQAIEFGFYYLGQKHYTIGFRFDRLLEIYGDEIWQNIRDMVKESQVIVTTFKKEDINFKDFILTRLEKEEDSKPIVTVKGDPRDTPYLNFTLNSKREQLKGKKVLLVFSTLSTSEKLKNISSLLCSLSAASIKVICLVNRMGVNTTGFISRIKKLTGGKEPGQKIKGSSNKTNSSFVFQSIYSIMDLNMDALTGMHQSIDAVLLQYQKSTKVPNFRRLARQSMEDFKPRTIIPPINNDREIKKLKKTFSLNLRNLSFQNKVDPIPVKSQQGKLALLSYYVAYNRDFKPLIDELLDAEDQKTLHHIFGLLILDIDFIRFSGKLKEVIDKLNQRIIELRNRRFAREKERKKNERIDIVEKKIKRDFEVEISLMFGLSLLSHFGETKDYDTGYFSKLLFYDMTPAKWQKYPINLKVHFSDEQLMYCISLMIFGVFRNFNEPKTAVDLKEKLKIEIGKFVEFLPEFLKSDILKRYTKKFPLANTLKNNLDLLLTEIGVHDLTESYQVIRYLHEQIIRPKEGHNPIFTNLRLLNTNLQQLFHKFEVFHIENQFYEVELNSKTLEKVGSALNSTASLQIVSEAVRQLFRFAPNRYQEQERYVNDENHPGFARDVQELEKLLVQIRSGKKISYHKYQKFLKLRGSIQRDFYSARSVLRKSLEAYVVSLLKVMEDSLYEVNESLKGKYGEIWREEYEKIKALREASEADFFVLIDYHLIKETLRNIFSNVRHSFNESDDDNPADLSVNINVEKVKKALKLADTLEDFIKIVVSVTGTPPDASIMENRRYTIADQRSKIGEFGGTLSLKHFDDNKGFSSVLELISRTGFLINNNIT